MADGQTTTSDNVTHVVRIVSNEFAALVGCSCSWRGEFHDDEAKAIQEYAGHVMDAARKAEREHIAAWLRRYTREPAARVAAGYIERGEMNG